MLPLYVFNWIYAGLRVSISSSALLHTVAAISMLFLAFGCWCFRRRLIVGDFVSVRSSVLLSEFGCWCFSRRSIAGAFVGVRSSVLSSAFNHRCFCRSLAISAFAGVRLSMAQAGCNPEMSIELL